MQREFDVIIIGGGVVGSAVARELSRYQLKIAVLEKELDVCNGVSGHNTGLLHSGILQKPGSLSAEVCLESNAEFDQVAKELDIPFRRCGKLFIGTKEEKESLEHLYEQGLLVGVPDIQMIGQDKIKEIEPNANGEYAIWVPSAGILDPFQFTIALAENAAMNGAKYFFDQEVIHITYDKTYQVQTTQEVFSSRWVINCAGLEAYRISEMLGFKAYIPDRVKGEYIILDKRLGEKLKHPLYPAPNASGACDVHVTPSIDGNILVGPTLESIVSKIDYDATQPGIEKLQTEGEKLFSYVKREYYIRNYAGNFPVVVNPDTKESLDFEIQTDKTIPYTVNLVNITSPGLTSAIPIARRVVDKMKRQETFIAREDFCPERKAIVRFAEQNREEQTRLIKENADYGEIFCRCESVTKAEIKQAIHNILGVSTVSAIKYRTRASMGRCQGGYCETRITSLIQEELKKEKTEIKLNKKGGYMFVGEVKSYEKA